MATPVNAIHCKRFSWCFCSSSDGQMGFRVWRLEWSSTMVRELISSQSPSPSWVARAAITLVGWDMRTKKYKLLPPAMLSTVGYLHATGEISKDNHAWRVGDVDIFFAFQGPFFLTKEEDLELLHRHNLLKSPGAVLVADNVLSTAAVGLLWRTGRGILHMRVIWIEGV